jgi:hypothetical protein
MTLAAKCSNYHEIRRVSEEAILSTIWTLDQVSQLQAYTGVRYGEHIRGASMKDDHNLVVTLVRSPTHTPPLKNALRPFSRTFSRSWERLACVRQHNITLNYFHC